jgi:predicted TIM-barrel fold metal-dependent hydrolase
MIMDCRVISADNHINEPPWVFDRVPNALKDRAPKMMRGTDGGDGWSFDGQPPKRTFGIEAMAGYAKKDFRLSGMRFDELRPGNYDGAAHLKDMDIDGVYGSVTYPAHVIFTYIFPDRELALACLRSYNDWILEDFQSADPKRLIALPLLPTEDGMETCLAEFERVLKKGAKAMFIPGMPTRPYNDPYYDPLWRAASDADIALTFHRTFGGRPDKTDWDELVDQKVSVGGIVFRYFSGVRPLTYMIFAGVFDRFPGLKIVAGEVDAGWVPFWVQTMDNQWEAQQAWFPQKLEHKPSDFVGRNVFTTAIDDYVGYDLISTGKYPYLANSTMFSSDYPHSATIWPNSAKVAAEVTQSMSKEDQHKVLEGNAVRVFGFGAD